MKSMPNLNEFALACHEASERKGWTNLDRSDAQTINLMISELSEAIEEFRNKKGLTEIYYEGKNQEGLPVTYSYADAQARGFQAKGGMKPCGIPIELADCVIRIGQQCGTHKLDLIAGARESDIEGVLAREDLSEMLADSSKFLSEAWQASPQFDGRGRTIAAGNVKDKLKFTTALAAAISSIHLFCLHQSIDLWAAVEEKMAYNETRPMLHGGKAI